MSRGGGHWGGGKGLPHLPCHLQYCPQGQTSQGPWHNGHPLPLTTRKCSYIYPAEHSPGGTPSWTGTYPMDSSFLLPQQWPDPYLSPSSSTTCLTSQGLQSPSEATSKVTPEQPSHSKWKEEMPFHKALSRSHQEAFSRDSRLVWKAREDYYQENCLHFNSENSCNLMGIFWNMINSTGLLGPEIYEIQETWTGQHELEYANYTLNTLPKGFKFFHPVSPSESLKVMGLTSIHHPDTLHHFNGVTHCLWCGKEGQNEGMIINHLWTMH